jgi:pimeloyl-ACP methyl ester carboxylesterase
MAVFGLIPGAFHDAWCWNAVVRELEERGHGAVAVDLPCDDPSADFARYVDVTRDALASGGDDLILVGHSLGAHTAVRAVDVMTVRGIIFLCGVIPPRDGEDDSAEPEMEAAGTFDRLELDDEGRMWFPDPADAIAAFYHDCDAATAAEAVAHLRRQSRTPHRDLGVPLSPPPVPSVSIVCADDRVAAAAWGRWAAHERLLDVPVIELAGSHSPFLSRPVELTDALVASLAHL